MDWCNVSLADDTIEIIGLTASCGAPPPMRRYTAESAVLEGND